MHLQKEFTLRSAFTIAFVFVSPIVALYGVFALVLMSAGPAGWWAFVIVLIGQLFVAGVFAQLASRWPLEGSVYQWSRRLGGESYGWFAGWAYMWSLMVAVSGGGYFVSAFLPVVLGIEPFAQTTQIAVAMCAVMVVTLLNGSGPRVVKTFAVLSLVAEVVGSLVIGTVLLVAHRNQSISVLFESFGSGSGSGGYVWSGLLAAAGFVGWAFVGFESAGAIAEEVVDARRNVPKAIVASLVAIGVVVLYSALALILAIPDMNAVVAGQVGDPAAATAEAAFGPGITRPLFGLIIIGFLASMLAAQTSGSRVLWSFGRDGVLPASRHLARLSGPNNYPVISVAVAGTISAAVLLAGAWDQAYATLVSFSTGGFFVAFAMPVLALLIQRARKQWVPGSVSLGRWGAPTTTIAAAWVVFELVNIAWPRNPQLAWFENYIVVIALLVVAAFGVLLWLTARPSLRRLAGEGPDESANGQAAGTAYGAADGREATARARGAGAPGDRPCRAGHGRDRSARRGGG